MTKRTTDTGRKDAPLANLREARARVDAAREGSVAFRIGGIWSLAIALLAALTITTSLAILKGEPEDELPSQCGSDADCAVNGVVTDPNAPDYVHGCAPGANYSESEDGCIFADGTPQCATDTPPAKGCRASVTVGDYVPGETPCQEDEVWDYVGQECIHVDRILPVECVGATALTYEVEGGSPGCAVASDAGPATATPCGPLTLPGCGERPTPGPDMGDRTLPDKTNKAPGTLDVDPDAGEDADGCNPPNTWAGSEADGFKCVPLSELEANGGRSGHIVTPNGRVNYHTGECAANETRLDPPYADVPLCVRDVDVPLLGE